MSRTTRKHVSLAKKKLKLVAFVKPAKQLRVNERIQILKESGLR